MIKFSIPAMFTDTQLEKIKKLNDESINGRIITEVYGSIPGGPVGTIRPSSMLPQQSEQELLEYIKKAKLLGIGFNYIMNASVLDGFEYTMEGRYELISFIEKLEKAGVSSVSVTVPYLIELIKKYFPTLRITASICAEIDSVQRALDFAKLGVECIVPAKDTNRDFEILENLQSSYVGEIKLLATTPCNYKCTDLFYHMNLSAIQDNNLKQAFKMQGKILSHTTTRCQKKRLECLEEYIKSPWIRPEDIPYYERIGIYSFKLDGRDRGEEYNMDVATAYMKGNYDGNLLYLMQNYYPKNSEEFELETQRTDANWKLGVYVDNSKLNGFLKAFVDKSTLCKAGCEKCHYCDSWAKNVITIQEKNVKEYLEILTKAEDAKFAIQ